MLEDLPVLAAQLRTGHVSAAEATRTALAAASADQASLNPWIRLHLETSVIRARTLDTARVAGRPLGPLHGVPIAVKDNIDEAGVPCTAGCRAYADRVPAKDAPVVARLRDAGAVILGRTNMHELADGVTSENPHYGPVRNPWDPGRHPGGSSGGSGVAVATGSVAGALGTDTGGSVRIPASLCGVVGLKPTRALVPVAGVLPLSPTLDHVGPIARSVAAVRVLLGVLSGRYLPAGSTAWTGLRVGVLGALGQDPDPEVAARFDEALALLASLGARLAPARVEGFERGIRLLAAIYAPEAAALHGARFDERPDAFGPEARRVIERARGRDPSRRETALADMACLEAAARGVFASFDLLVSPATPHAARPFGSPDPHTYLAYTCPFDLTGQPAVSVPMGLAGGLPVGLQIAARHGADARLLDAAEGFERAMGGFHPPPLNRPSRGGPSGRPGEPPGAPPGPRSATRPR